MTIESEPETMATCREWRWDLVVWTKSYETGHTDIDEDHKRLFGLFNEFSMAVNDGKGALVIRGLLDDLRAYTLEHFRREEDLMRHADYPEFARHKKMHDTFERQIGDVASHVDVGADMAAFLLSFLAKWLSGHILTADRRFGAYLEAQGLPMH